MVLLLILLLSLASAGTALALLVRAALLPRMRTGETLGQIGSYGFTGGDTSADAAPDRRLLPRLAGGVGRALSGGEARQEEARKLLLSAGVYGTGPVTFMGYRVLAGVITGGTLFWVTVVGGRSPALAMLAGAYGGFMAWMALLFLLKSRARRRIERVEIEMPELIDLLVVTLEAGLGFSTALQRSADRIAGPLGEELRLALREYELGFTVEQALRNMLSRCDAPATRSFMRAVTQGHTLGISIGQIMRALAGDLRKRRRQIIEERAHKATIKILFPLAVLILPALLIVVLYPGLANVMQVLGGG